MPKQPKTKSNANNKNKPASTPTPPPAAGPLYFKLTFSKKDHGRLIASFTEIKGRPPTGDAELVAWIRQTFRDILLPTDASTIKAVPDPGPYPIGIPTPEDYRKELVKNTNIVTACLMAFSSVPDHVNVNVNERMCNK